ncbi:hypothetical protein PHLGIDRAFT_25356 [Phlebiopsis gigantea 11061_1 CR5-6]|uniref:VWFA domain-containing protein n=1 Tax=Phlebiopsis gigantea (strain 11061_1 CR5-6) TaxID=745531 RepID=A0A0C3S7U3_PHLG1|nr:hypothetical protein PHLGIDRAFT_25356 [Phlebiopsis gigantea 11061_1 CR5-6]
MPAQKSSNSFLIPPIDPLDGSLSLPTNRTTPAPPSYSPSVLVPQSHPLSVPAPQSSPTKASFDFGVDESYGVASGEKKCAAKDVAGTSAPRYEVEDGQLQYLRMFDTVIVMDDSGSMVNLWAEAREACIHIAAIAARQDQDGVDLYFMNWEKAFFNIVSTAQMVEAFEEIGQPRGYTPLGACLKRVLDGYIGQYRDMKEEDEVRRREGKKQREKPAPKSKGNFLSRLLGKKETAGQEEPAGLRKVQRAQQPRWKHVKPINVIVITDGAPSDSPEYVLRDVIREMDALKMPHNQIGVQFVQIGSDADATAYLKNLDDNPGPGLRDIVDTVKWGGGRLDDSRFIAKILLGSIIRRIDGMDSE